jgi:CRP/FNR family transcriptional regulator, anaerobic regulatory protein
MQTLELLRRNPVLAAANTAALGRLALRSTVGIYGRGDRVATLGSPQEEVLMLAAGAVELWMHGKRKNASLLVGLLHPPALFGDAELFTGSPWLASARAAVDGTTVVRMPNGAFNHLVRADGAAAYGLYADACSRLMLVMRTLRVVGIDPAEQRLLALLSSQAEPGSATPRVRLSQARLARALGVDRKTVARDLAALERSGAVRRDGKEAVLLEAPAQHLTDVGRLHGFGTAWRLARQVR